MFNTTLGHDEWNDTLERLVEWSQFLELSPREAFERLAKILESEHFGIEFCEVEHFGDISGDDAPSMQYLNMGDSYATTLILTDDYHNGVQLQISSWADWLEECERYHAQESHVQRCFNCGHWTADDYPICEHCNRTTDSGIEIDSNDIDEFWNGYLIGLAFTAHAGVEMNEPVEEWHFPGQDIADCVAAQDVEERIGENNARELKADCIDFLASNLHLMRPDVSTLRAALLQWGIDHPGRLDDCPDDLADDDVEELALEIGLIRSMDDLGSDFHLTRNGHGAGFWDRQPLLFADELTSAAEVYSSCGLWQLETGEFEIVN